MYENLNFEIANDAAVIEIDTQSKFNSINKGFLQELHEVTSGLIEHDEVRAITITGTDDVFCSGLDLSLLNRNQGDAEKMRELVNLYHNSLVNLTLGGKPVITGVNGIAAGGGFSLAIMGDIVIAREDAEFDFAYHRVGLTGDFGATYYLPRILGLRKAFELVLLDESIDADQAIDLGLASKKTDIEEFRDELSSITQDISMGPTTAFGKIKRMFLESYGNSLQRQMVNEMENLAQQTQTEDYIEGLRAFQEGTEPEYTGR